MTLIEPMEERTSGPPIFISPTPGLAALQLSGRRQALLNSQFINRLQFYFVSLCQPEGRGSRRAAAYPVRPLARQAESGMAGGPHSPRAAIFHFGVARGRLYASGSEKGRK